jgi:hypothetical protein
MRSWVLAAGVVLLIVPGAARATAYTIQYVYIPDSTDTYLTSINNLGQAVGFSVSGIEGPESGVVVSGGVVSTFNIPGEDTTRLGGINDRGQIVGQYYNSYSGGINGFIDTNGVITTVNPPGLSGPLLTGINNAGDVVGVNGGYDAFVIRSGKLTVFGSPTLYTDTYAINDSGVVSGTVNYRSGFIYDESGYRTVDYPGAVTTEFGAINDFGQVVGTAAFGNGYGGPTSFVTFIYSNGVFTTIDATLPGSPIAMNDDGVIIGEYFDSSIRVPLESGGYIQGAQGAFIATPVQSSPVSTPEPATFAVLGTALAGLIVRQERRCRRT